MGDGLCENYSYCGQRMVTHEEILVGRCVEKIVDNFFGMKKAMIDFTLWQMQIYCLALAQK